MRITPMPSDDQPTDPFLAWMAEHVPETTVIPCTMNGMIAMIADKLDVSVGEYLSALKEASTGRLLDYHKFATLVGVDEEEIKKAIIDVMEETIYGKREGGTP